MFFIVWQLFILLQFVLEKLNLQSKQKLSNIVVHKVLKVRKWK